MDDLAGAVADDLNLDMPCPSNQQLDVDRIIAKRHVGLRAAALILFFNVLAGLDDAHAATATTGNRFDHHALVGVLIPEGESGLEASVFIGARQQWHAGFECPGPGAGFVAKGL